MVIWQNYATRRKRALQNGTETEIDAETHSFANSGIPKEHKIGIHINPQRTYRMRKKNLSKIKYK